MVLQVGLVPVMSDVFGDLECGDILVAAWKRGLTGLLADNDNHGDHVHHILATSARLLPMVLSSYVLVLPYCRNFFPFSCYQEETQFATTTGA
eukprot:scaffold24345_cov64-Attheya_sp.AAC.10